jgi:scyllo-inositol 2-dehydrogenase (NADP+)
MSTNPVRYAVVGLGRAGWNIHVEQLRPRTDAKIVAVVDPVEERRNQAITEFGCKAYTSLDEMLKQADVEVVVVATPSICHGPDVKKAVAAGKHAVVEKPMAMSITEADSMIQAASNAGKKLFVHQNYRFFPNFNHMKSVVESGIIGKVYHIRNYSSGFSRRNDWQTLNKNGGGVLNNTCPHNIDQALQLLGSPVLQVMGDLRQIASAGDVEDHVKAFMRCENGATFDLEVSSSQAVAAALPAWIICGTNGTYTSNGKEATIKWFDPKAAPALTVHEGPATDRKYGNDDKLPWQEKTEPAKGPDVGNFYDNVYGVLRDNKPMAITPESVREVIRVIALIRQGTKFPGQQI